MATRVRTNAPLTIAVILGSITAIALLIGLVLLARYWLSIQNSSPSEAAAYIVNDYGASSAHCRDVDPGEFACWMTFRGCPAQGRITYDGPGIYPWINANPLGACPGYRQP